jgi:general secretion pathway protein E/type IV pilus assembly protein PilB
MINKDNSVTAGATTPDNYITSSSETIIELLIAQGLITVDQVQLIYREQKEMRSKDKQFKELLIEFGFISETVLTQALSHTDSYKKINLSNIALDLTLLTLLPKEVAMKLKVVPLEQTEDILYVALADRDNITIIDQLYKYFPKDLKIIPYQAEEYQIHELIDQYYGYQMTIDGIIKEIESGDAGKALQELSGSNAYVNPTVRLIDAILVDAIKCAASDIHFGPEHAFLRIRYRVDGKLTPVMVLHQSYYQKMVVRIKILANLNIAETRNPQNGRISYNVMGKDINFRVSTQPTIHGENIVIRILDQKKSLVALEDLGFSEHNKNNLLKALQRHYGIIFVTGPTGSGKSTTLYSLLKFINNVDKNIMTLEDPVEYQLPLIRQSNVQAGTGMNFHDGIKAMMRQDPDIIFVGEIRDGEAAMLAIRAAMTGHQVFTTLHANDAVNAFSRLIDLGVSEKILAGVIISIIAQRLARKLCAHCKSSVTATSAECRILGQTDMEPPIIYRAVGCEKCSYKGYKGRVVISEVLTMDDNLDDLVATGATNKVIAQYLATSAFVTMAEDGAEKVLAGVIDIMELVNTINMTARL